MDVAPQQRECGPLHALVVIERLPLELDDLPRRRRAAPQYTVHLLDAAAHLVHPLAQVVCDLLDERIAEHAPLLGGQDLLAISDLGVQSVEHFGQRLLASGLGHAHQQQSVLAAAGVPMSASASSRSSSWTLRPTSTASAPAELRTDSSSSGSALTISSVRVNVHA